MDRPNNSTQPSGLSENGSTGIPRETAFSIMFVSVGMSCFIWQSITAGWMFYKARKPILGIVFAQATLGIVVTFITLLTSLVDIDCTFRLIFSVVGVNLADISLQFVLLWKAYLGNNRSKVVLTLGSIHLVAIMVFIWVNMTIGKSKTFLAVGLCSTEYPTYIVIAKAIIDCTSNTFLSACFILVIYRHYRILGSSIQKTLITEGLIYCFGVCFSNILTGILLAKNVLGGSTPILYTIDWYLASYLIIKQLRHRGVSNKKQDDDEDIHDDEDDITIESNIEKHKDEEEEEDETSARRGGKKRDTYYNSLDGTLVSSSPTYFSDDEIKYPVPTNHHNKPLEQKIYSTLPVAEKNTLEYNNTQHYSSSITDIGTSETGENNNDEEKIIQQEKEKYEGRLASGELSRLVISQKSIDKSLDPK